MDPDLNLNRRAFLALTGVAAVAGCAAPGPAKPEGRRERAVDAGPASDFAADRVYGNFREEGFFITRKAGKLVAISSICTHRHCKLDAEPDRSYYCHCHGSTFDAEGRVTEGPAKLDLPGYPTAIDGRGHLIVTITG